MRRVHWELSFRKLASDYSREMQDVLQELYARQPESQVRPRLEPTRRAVEILGDPQQNYGIIHITGTNGKTSTARIIERILREHGLRTGRLTSPHLIHFNERIAIDGEPVSDEVFIEAYNDTKPLLEIVDNQLVAEGEQKLTFFEAMTAIAFQIFSDAPIDVLVLEVGMGGEWDSTNVADADVAVFTPIDLDHQKSLGDTIAEIAATKAGIIKSGSLAVSSNQTQEADQVLRERGVELFAGQSFGVSDISADGFGVRFSVQGLAGEYPFVWMPMLGEHQAQNAATAIAAVELFLGGGHRAIADEVLRQALADAVSPGRLHVIEKDPLIVLDGAHNPHGIRSLRRALAFHFSGRELIGVVATLADKDWRQSAQELSQTFNKLIITQAPGPRALPAEDFAEVFTDLDVEVLAVEPDAVMALELLRGAMGDNSVGVLTGSLYMVGEVLASVRENSEDE